MASRRTASPESGHASGSAWRRTGEGRRLRFRQSTDLLVAALLALVAALAASFMPDGNPIRLFVTLAIILSVPGYLLIQALIVPPARPAFRAVHALLGVGLSPALVGLLALSTAMVPGGFRPMAIVAAITAACVMMALVAFARRSLQSTHPELPVATPSSVG